MCGSVESGPSASEQPRDENMGEGLGKSSKEASEFTVVDSDESRGRLRLWAKDDSASSAEQGGKQVSAWSCAAGPADTLEGGGATYVNVALPPYEQAESTETDLGVVSEWSKVGGLGVVQVGKKGVGGS